MWFLVGERPRSRYFFQKKFPTLKLPCRHADVIGSRSWWHGKEKGNWRPGWDQGCLRDVWWLVRQQLCCVQSSALLIKHLNDIIDIKNVLEFGAVEPARLLKPPSRLASRQNLQPSHQGQAERLTGLLKTIYCSLWHVSGSKVLHLHLAPCCLIVSVFLSLRVSTYHTGRRVKSVGEGKLTPLTSPHPHPLTDSHEILHTWLRPPYLPTSHIRSRSPQGLLLPYSQSYHSIFFLISFFARKNLSTDLELRPLNRFCHAIYQRTRIHAG